MTHVDWSCDSRHVQVNTAGGGLKFFTAPQCDAVAAAVSPAAQPQVAQPPGGEDPGQKGP